MLNNECLPHLIKNNVFTDDRGFFSRIDIPDYFGEVKQSNYVINNQKGMIRGLHWQRSPKNEKKIVRVIKGKIFDVLVDIKKSSNSYGEVFNFILEENSSSLYVPDGFAHGYQTLTSKSEILYLHSEKYYPDLSKTLFYNCLDIKWPLKISKISKKDLLGIKLNDL